MKTPNQFNSFAINHPSSLSRRRWIGSGLAACGYLAAGGLVPAQTDDTPVPTGYTLPGPVTDRGRAPGLQSRVVAENPGGEKTFAVIFAKGDEILSGLTEFAEREKLTAGYFTAIGALQGARIGWFDADRKAFRDIPIDQQVEMISLIGNVGLVNGAPAIHAHGAVALELRPSRSRNWLPSNILGPAGLASSNGSPKRTVTSFAIRPRAFDGFHVSLIASGDGDRTN